MTTKPSTQKSPKQSTAEETVVIFGKALSKKEYEQRLARVGDFVTAHNEKMRVLVDTIGKIRPDEIDDLTAKTFSPSHAPRMRAFSAWEVYAWNVIINPYQHPSRSYQIDLSPYRSLIDKDAETLYLFGLACEVKPSEEIYKKLKTLHPEYAAQYLDYCKDYTVAEKVLGDSALWPTRW